MAFDPAESPVDSVPARAFRAGHADVLVSLSDLPIRPSAGSVGVSDILFVVLLGDAAQNGMIGQAMGWADSALVIATLVGWNYGLNYLGYHVQLIERLTDPPPLLLIRNGRALRRRRMRFRDGFAGARTKCSGDVSFGYERP